MPLPKPGEVVVLDGFVARRAMNGRSGTVVAHKNGDHHDTASGRVRVHLHGTPFTIKVHGEQCFRPVEAPVEQVTDTPIKPVTPPVRAAKDQAVFVKRGKVEEPKMAAVGGQGHQPCGKVYAEIQAKIGRDVHRLRNLGLSYFKDTHKCAMDAPQRLKPGPPRAHHTTTTKEKFDWRQRIPRYVDPSRIPHEMGGHGKEMFDLELRALVSPRVVPMARLQEGASLPEQFSWASRSGCGQPLNIDSTSDSPNSLPPLQAGPALSKWQEGSYDSATTAMSELAQEADWATREPSTVQGGGISTDFGSTSAVDPPGCPPPSSSTMAVDSTVVTGSAVHGPGLSTEYGDDFDTDEVPQDAPLESGHERQLA